MFTTRAKLTTFTASRWRLIESLTYLTNAGPAITVPKGFVCDLASIPRVMRLVFTVNGNHREAAIIHDWLYYKKGHVVFSHFTREQCDDVFYEAMISSGVNKITAWSMWAGVRLGGWVAWQK